MAIFGNLKVENTLQVNDKTRLSGVDSFVSKDESAITLVRIEPEASAGFIDVTGSNFENWFLDWAYTSNGTKTVTLEITTDGAPETFTETIEVLTESEDRLFSNDSDLVEIEDQILRFIRKGRNSFKDKHRQAQKRIIDSLDRRKVFDLEGNRLTKNDLFSIEEIKQWSTYLTLQIIFESLRVETDDIYSFKADGYRSLAGKAEHTAVLRFDFDQDADEDRVETLMSGRLLRR